MKHWQGHHNRGATPPPATEASAWFAGRVPDGWFTTAPSVTADTDELLVVGTIPDVELAADVTEADRGAARSARISRFREETREARMAVADEAERRFGRKVSWGVELAGQTAHFTTVSSPVMTRLRQPERQVLDTLIEAGVARSRSEALAWCVRLVGRNQTDWLGRLREALGGVETARGAGPEV